MFSMSLGIKSRTARGFAAAALILSLTATTAGSANAAPLADETQDCSSAAHARNDAVHLLHTAWKAFDGDLKNLARDARKLQHESEKASAVASKDARGVIASAKAELKDIASQAHSDIQAAVDLGTACADESDSTTTTTTTTTTAATTSVTAPKDATAPADTTGSAHTFDTSGLDSKYKDIVDQAIKDMQKVVDDARKALLDMTTVAESKDTTEKDAEKVEQEVEKAKADRVTAKQDREDGKKADKAKVAKVKATTKSQNSDKANAKTKAKVRNANTNEERD
jgi:hypothetical protein